MKALENEARERHGGNWAQHLTALQEVLESLGYKVVEEKSRDVGEGQRLDFWKAVKQLPKS